MLVEITLRFEIDDERLERAIALVRRRLADPVCLEGEPLSVGHLVIVQAGMKESGDAIPRE